MLYILFSERSDALPVSECWWLYLHQRWHVHRFSQMDLPTVHCTDKAGHCLIFFIVIISLSDWPSSLVSSSLAATLIVRVRCYQLTWSLSSILPPVLQFSLHGTSKFHWKFCFAQGLREKGEMWREYNVWCLPFVNLPSHTILQTVDAENLISMRPNSGSSL